MLPAGAQVLGLKAPSERWNEAQLQLFTDPIPLDADCPDTEPSRPGALDHDV